MTKVSKLKDKELDDSALARQVHNGDGGYSTGHKLMGKMLKGENGEDIMPGLASWSRALKAQAGDLNEGDFSSLIGRLNGHMVTMEPLFLSLAHMALEQTNIDAMNKFLNMAMKVQSNMRMTAEAIVNVKHPRQQVNFVRSEVANLTNGNQQNITNQSAHTEKQMSSNEILEAVINGKQ